MYASDQRLRCCWTGLSCSAVSVCALSPSEETPLPQVPPGAPRGRCQSVAFVHTFISAWPLSSFPPINILAAAVSHVTPNWQRQQREGKEPIVLPPSHQFLCQYGIQSTTMGYCATRIACYCFDGVGKGSLFLYSGSWQSGTNCFRKCPTFLSLLPK